MFTLIVPVFFQSVLSTSSSWRSIHSKLS